MNLIEEGFKTIGLSKFSENFPIGLTSLTGYDKFEKNKEHYYR